MMALMIRPLAALLAFLACVAPATAQQRNVPVTDFDRIEVEGPFQVRLVRGNVTRATVAGPRRSIDAVSIETQGQTLRIRRNPNVWGGYPGGRAEAPAIVTLTTRNLRSARVIGAGSLEIESARGMRLDLSLEGSGRVRAVDVQVDRLSVGLRGAGMLSLAGAAETFNADIQGAGTLDAEALAAGTATVSAATTGTVSLTAQREATITAAGLGNVDVSGTAPCTIRGPAAGNVRCASAR